MTGSVPRYHLHQLRTSRKDLMMAERKVMVKNLDNAA